MESSVFVSTILDRPALFSSSPSVHILLHASGFPCRPHKRRSQGVVPDQIDLREANSRSICNKSPKDSTYYLTYNSTLMSQPVRLLLKNQIR